MSKQDVKNFFEKYVFDWMFSDIQREIDLARSNKRAGNFLCALGLLCYTEFMGGIVLGSFRIRPLQRSFDAFLDLMGADYKTFNQTVDVYHVFRCGLAHEYFVKHNCDIAMLRNDETLGIGKKPTGEYYFVIERYFEDFSNACRQLYMQKMASPNPSLPNW
ncbi:MAG: hypothetical protein KAU16_06985 [Methanophagales archaeon]|nr:hypothetical protein [Methanophagales archaeon]